MRDIATLSAYLDKFTNKVIENVTKAQQETARTIWEDVINISSEKINENTGNYVSSIQVSPTEQNGNTIKTEIYTDATVSTLGGATYNLGYLLENGTSPHLIEPVNANVLHFQIGGEDIFTKRVNHPGTTARPHFKPALEKNINTYLQNIDKAVKEAE